MTPLHDADAAASNQFGPRYHQCHHKSSGTLCVPRVHHVHAVPQMGLSFFALKNMKGGFNTKMDFELGTVVVLSDYLFALYIYMIHVCL